MIIKGSLTIIFKIGALFNRQLVQVLSSIFPMFYTISDMMHLEFTMNEQYNERSLDWRDGLESTSIIISIIIRNNLIIEVR